MERIRINNDIRVEWEIVVGAESSSIPYDLSGRNLTLYLTNTYGREKVEGFTTDGNVIHWTFLGREQKHTGIYMLTLVENEGMDGMHTVDECDAFELVRCSCNEGGEAESSVTIHTVRLQSGISINSLIPDTELDEESHNVVENMAVAKAMKNKADVSDLESLSVEIHNKADISAVDALGSDLYALTTIVYNKADISDLNALSKVVNNKASQSDLDTLSEEVSYQASVLAEKADKSGDYPNMSVGLAEDLGGRPFFEDAEFSFRATAGSDVSIKDGLAIAKELRGNAVVWNQLVQAIDGANYGYSIKWNNGKVTLTNVSASTPDYGNIAIIQGWIPIVGHKYILLSDAPSSIQICYNSQTGFIDYANTISTAPSLDYSNGMYLRTHASPSLDLLPVGGSIEFTYVIHDLTKMFGAGNEPTTIEEFYSRRPLGVDMNAYNAGEMIADNSTAIKSIGDNAWDEVWGRGYIYQGIIYEEGSTGIVSKNYIKVLPGETYHFFRTAAFLDNNYVNFEFYDENHAYLGENYIITLYENSAQFSVPASARYMRFFLENMPTYDNDITISLYHSGWKAEVDNVYKPYVEFTREIDQRILDAFPNGRKPWDKVYNKNGKGYIVKGTGEVDLGSLNWINDSWNGVVAFSTLDVGNSTPHVYDLLGNSLTAIYSQKSNFAFLSEGDNKVYVLNSEAHIPNTLAIRDSAYTDASTFKTAMNGVMLWYELAEPTIIEYDEPFALDYEVWDFGTEQIISDTPSAPMRASIQYDFNANDTIRTNRLAIGTLRMEVLELRRQIESIMASITNTTEE